MFVLDVYSCIRLRELSSCSCNNNYYDDIFSDIEFKFFLCYTSHPLLLACILLHFCN